MTTAELMMAWPRLFESELAEPILSVMDGPVRVRARVLRPLLRVLCPRAPTRRPHTHAVRLCGCCCTVLLPRVPDLAGKRTHVV